MFSNYIKTTLRHLSKNALYAGINVIGLVAGVTAMLLAILFWRDEVSFDNFHAAYNNLYRVTTTLKETSYGDKVTVGGTGQVQGRAFKAAVPEIQSYARVMGGDIYTEIVAAGKSLKLRSLYVDSNFLDLFTFPLLRGNSSTALQTVNSIVLTASTAKKLFNSTDVVGKIVTLEADPSFERLNKPLIVSGVVTDPPENSSLQFEVLFPFAFMELSFQDNSWLNAYLGTFVLLDPNANAAQVNTKLNLVYASHAREQVANNIKTYGFDPGISYQLQPIGDIHFHPLMSVSGNAEAGIVNGSKSAYSIVFLVIAAFILLMACINFINISIAGSLKRSKEVGIRKVSGGSVLQIIFQFLTESTLHCLVAFVLSLFALSALLPAFNELTGKVLHFSDGLDMSILGFFTLLLVAVIALTGIYPAYILSKFNAHEVLYNKPRLAGRGLSFRGLVILQFTPAIILLISAIVYYRQMEYIHTSDLGYNPNGIIRTAVSGNRDYASVTRFLTNELAKEPAIKAVSFGNNGWSSALEVNGKKLEAFHKMTDENYLTALEIPLVAGRNFSAATPGDDDAVIVNESFVREAGIEQPIGATVKLGEYYDNRRTTIIGVVKDYHFNSLRVRISPMVIFKSANQQGEMWVKVEKSKMQEGIAALQKAYKSAMPNAVFEYAFMNELNAREFERENRWQKGIGMATGFSLLICCLGLFGLAHLSASRRIKEIGIRKVLGASVVQIVALLTGSFLKLVLISFIVAVPFALYVMNGWLGNFAYRIRIDVSLFLVAGGIAGIMAIVAVAVQCFLYAVASPVKSLKNE